MFDEWQAQVVFHPGRVANGIYLSRKRDYGSREFLTEGGAVVKTVKNDEPHDGDLEFAWLDGDQMRALATAFNNHGVKLPDAGHSEGKLEAMELHLHDMRQLVFQDTNLTLKERE